MNIRKFHIHGDNIVECERTLVLIIRALGDSNVSISGPKGSPACPEFIICVNGSNEILHFTFFPGFGRWNHDILKLIKELGGVLREATDAIITRVDEGHEFPILFIEYCGALPAGNQAWQRSGRAYSLGLTGIPYLYISELGGFELDSDRSRKSPRMPNPAVPFSYVSFSIERKTPVLPIFITSPGADQRSRTKYAEEFADNELINIVHNIITEQPLDAIVESVIKKVLSFINKRSKVIRNGITLTPQEWENAYLNLNKGQSLVDFLISDARLSWSKTAYIDSLTDSAKKIMAEAAKLGIGLTSTQLPICIIENDKRKGFASCLKNIYTDLPHDFINWLERDGNLVVCWIMGFKPAGDDARPDRGLPPFTRMLIGDNCDLLSVIYGPAPISTWPLLQNKPEELITRNGLWESILNVSDAILVDSSTDKITNHGFCRSHWNNDTRNERINKILVSPKPLTYGENDVDTVLHTLFSRFGGSNVFEGMCNPPGGDWSGVSLLLKDNSKELRWLSLPRVSGTNSKRPDHLFQLFGITTNPIILTIESKETAKSVEENIGPRLNKYISNLLSKPASIERSLNSEKWEHSEKVLDINDFIFISAVAFIQSESSQITSIAKSSKADIVFTFSFEEDGEICYIRIHSTTQNGNLLIEFIDKMNLNSSGMGIIIT